MVPNEHLEIWPLFTSKVIQSINECAKRNPNKALFSLLSFWKFKLSFLNIKLNIKHDEISDKFSIQLNKLIIYLFNIVNLIHNSFKHFKQKTNIFKALLYMQIFIILFKRRYFIFCCYLLFALIKVVRLKNKNKFSSVKLYISIL